MARYVENPWINALINALVAFVTALSVASCTCGALEQL